MRTDYLMSPGMSLSGVRSMAISKVSPTATSGPVADEASSMVAGVVERRSASGRARMVSGGTGTHAPCCDRHTGCSPRSGSPAPQRLPPPRRGDPGCERRLVLRHDRADVVGPQRTSFVGKAEYLASCKTRRLFLALGLTPLDRQRARSAVATTTTHETVRSATSSIRTARSASSLDMTVSVKLRPRQGAAR